MEPPDLGTCQNTGKSVDSCGSHTSLNPFNRSVMSGGDFQPVAAVTRVSSSLEIRASPQLHYPIAADAAAVV